MELQAAKERLAGAAVLPNGVIPSVLGRKDDKKGGKRGREGEGVSPLSFRRGWEQTEREAYVF